MTIDRSDELLETFPETFDNTFPSVLNQVREHFARYIVTGTEHDLDILALWTAHTHLCLETYTSPRLVLDSPVPGSGKTTVLEHLERLTMNPVQMSSISSTALLVRILAGGIRTLLIDEADKSLNPKKPGIEDMLAVLNSGYKRGATRPVLEPTKDGSYKAKEMPTFAPVAMAGNAPQLPDDTVSRSITVLLMPATDDEVAETDWEAIEDSTKALGDMLAAAADAVREQVKANRPPVPGGCRGRAKERWLPLKRVAVAAGGTWPARVDQIIRQDLERESLMNAEGLQSRPPHIVLMHDLHRIVRELPRDFTATGKLISELVSINPDKWGPTDQRPKGLTAQSLGRMLTRHYGIHTERPASGDRARGYPSRAFERPFKALRLDVLDGSSGGLS